VKGSVGKSQKKIKTGAQFSCRFENFFSFFSSFRFPRRQDEKKAERRKVNRISQSPDCITFLLLVLGFGKLAFIVKVTHGKSQIICSQIFRKHVIDKVRRLQIISTAASEYSSARH
jgi:hypothetical protein